MSLALSVIVKPSKILRLCVTSFAVMLLSIAVYIASLKTLSVFNQSIFIALCCFAAWQSILYCRKMAKTSYRIHVDGQGKLRYKSTLQTDNIQDSAPYNLMAGTTLWTHTLFLRLHEPKQNTKMNLVIMSDSLSKDEFRRLSIACKSEPRYNLK